MKELILPNFYQVTPEPVDPPHFNDFLAQLDATLRSGVKLVQLRAKQLERPAHLMVARKALHLCHAHGALMVLNGCVDMAMKIGCDGVHLSSQQLMALQQRPADTRMLVSAACHSAEQLAQACKVGADFVTLSPVLPTGTHPDAEPLGWARFAELVSAAQVPVFALGGMKPELITQAKKAGAWGIAAISATWCREASGQ